MEKKERRHAERIKKTLYVLCRVYDTTAPWVSATVQDISEAGISISMMKQYPIGEVLEIKICTFLKSQPLNVLGNVVSRRENKNRKGSWVTGISFTDISEAEKPILKNLIQMFLKKAECSSADNHKTQKKTKRDELGSE